MTARHFARILLGLLLFFALLVCGTLAFVYFYDWNRSRPWINEQVTQALQREFAIHGPLAVEWHWPQPKETGWMRWIPGAVIQAQEVLLGHPREFEVSPEQAPHFAQIPAASIRLALPALWHRHFDIRHIHVSQADVRLIRRMDKSNNWTFQAAQNSDTHSRTPRWGVTLARLSIDGADISLDDAPLALSLRAQLSTLPQEESEDGLYGVGFNLEGSYAKAAVSGSGKLGELLSLTDQKLDFPLRFQASAGSLGATAAGIIENPRALSGVDFRVSLHGDSMADLYDLTGLVLPDTPPFRTRGRLTGSLQPDGATWQYRDFTGIVGESDLRGDVTYTSAQPRPRLAGKMRSRQLRLEDLGPIVGVHSTKPRKAPRAGKVLSDAPFAVERWDKMDLDLVFQGDRVIRPDAVPIDSLSVHALLQDAKLKLSPLDFGLAKGHFKTQVLLDSKTQPMRASLRGDVNRLQLSSLFPKIELMKKSLGRVDGGLALDSHGQSIADLLGNANGELRLYVREGVLSQRLLDLAGLNLGSLVVSRLFGSDKEVRMRCAIADVPVRAGVAHARNVKVNTDDALIEITGHADMAQEYVDLDIHPKAYQLKFFSLRTPLEVRGPFAKAHVGVKPGPLILRAGAAVAAIAAAPGALALLPITVPGAEDDPGCAPLKKSNDPASGHSTTDNATEAAERAVSRERDGSAGATPPQPAAGEFSAGSTRR